MNIFYLFSKNVKYAAGVDECANMKCMRIHDIALLMKIHR